MKKIDREIFSLALPNILSNLSIPLLGAVDLALMGHLNDVGFLGALALGTMIFNFVYFGFGFLRMSGTGLAAQAFGRSDGEANYQVFNNFGLIGILLGVLIVIFQAPIIDFSLWIIESEVRIEAMVYEYVSIRIWAAPATVYHGSERLAAGKSRCTYAFKSYLVGESSQHSL